MSYRERRDSVFFIAILSIVGLFIVALLASAFLAPMGVDRMCEEFNDAGE